MNNQVYEKRRKAMKKQRNMTVLILCIAVAAVGFILLCGDMAVSQEAQTKQITQQDYNKVDALFRFYAEKCAILEEQNKDLITLANTMRSFANEVCQVQTVASLDTVLTKYGLTRAKEKK